MNKIVPRYAGLFLPLKLFYYFGLHLKNNNGKF
jgi:hypothetical protein